MSDVELLTPEDEISLAAEQNKKAENQRKNELNDLKLVMETECGRRVIWRLMEQAGVFSSSYTGEALSSAFAEGKRNSGLRLFNEVMQACPDLYLVMAAEAKEETEE